MLLNPFGRHDNPHSLVVGMTGVKMGDRFLQVGCAHGGRLAAVAAKVGLSGRALAIVPDGQSAERARRGAAKEGVLIDLEIAPPTALAVEDGAFDVAVVDDTGGVLSGLAPHQRAPAIRELLRALRPGGRVVFIANGTPSGFGAILSSKTGQAGFDAAAALQAEGFKSVRELADREGLRFFEGIRPR